MKKKISLLIALSFVISIFAISGKLPSIKSFAAIAIQDIGLTNYTLKNDNVNMRQGPGTNYRIISTLRKGTTIKILGKTNGWYVAFDPNTGYVGMITQNLVKLYTPAPSTPIPTPKPTYKPKSPTTTATVTPSSATNLSQDEQTLLNLINQERSKAGIAALKVDSTLMKVARLKAKDMVDNNYFSHQSPTYGSPFDMMRQFGITFKTAGENIAGNQSIQGAVKAWMNSEGHRKNILNGSFNYTGIGVVSSPTYGKILVQQFIGR